MEKIEGFLEVGCNDAGEVVINHPDLKVDAAGVGHIVFSPLQARNLADLLLRHAGKAERDLRATREWDRRRRAEGDSGSGGALMTEAQLRRHPGPWTPRQWMLRTMILEPERICDPVEKQAWLAEYWRSKSRPSETPADAASRIESKQIRAGYAQGILAPSSVSPLASERRRSGAR